MQQIKSVLVCDRLEFTFKDGLKNGLPNDILEDAMDQNISSSIPNHYKNLSIKRLKTGLDNTSFYRRRYEIAINEDIAGLLFCDPVINNGTSPHYKFCVNNELLYKQKFKNVFCILQQKLSLQILNITKLEIACDTTENLIDKLSYLEKNYKIGGRLKSGFFCGNTRGKGIQASKNIYERTYYYSNIKNKTTVSCNKANKFVKIYNKTHEITHSSNKHYIKNFYNTNGLLTTPSTNSIYRFELSLTSDAIKKWHRSCTSPIHIKQLQDPKYLNKLFKDYLGTNFTFKHKNTQKKVNTQFPKALDHARKTLGARDYLKYVIKNPVFNN